MIQGLAVVAVLWFIGAAILHGHPRYQNPGGDTAPKGQRGRAPRAAKPPRQSKLLKMWNATGAPKTEEQRVGDAAAVLGGKAAGKVARSGTRFTTRAGQAAGRTVQRIVHWVAGKATQTGERRWNSRDPDATKAIRIIPETPTSDRPPYVDDPPPRHRPEAPTSSAPDSPGGPGSAQAREAADRGDTHAPDRPRPSEPAPTTTGNVIPMTTPNGATTAAGAYNTAPPPGDWGQTITRINGFMPDTDHELIEFMQREAAGVLGYATALIHLFENCVTGTGLDPVAMQGLSEYSAAAGEAAQAMTLAHRRFVTVYGEIMAAVQNGVVMPYNGRFFSRDAS